MTPPKPENIAPSTSTLKNGAANQAAPVSNAPPAEKLKEKLKPVTIQLSGPAHQRLKLLAVAKGTTTSGLVESYVEAAIRKDLAVALSKMTDE
jgi:tartrate dehydratase beta subunit/fumarate hydratase class I family protein